MASSLPSERRTLESFEFQWARLNYGNYLLSDPTFKEHAVEILLSELCLSRQELAGRKVLDIGCGGGRWSWAFARLGCHVVALDSSPSACQTTLREVPSAEVVQASAYHLPFRPGTFDLVFSFGVIHHTAHPDLCLITGAYVLSTKGIMHLYAYSKRRPLYWKFLRRLLRLISPLRRYYVILSLVKLGLLRNGVHQWFDALSPTINIELSEEQLARWLGDLNLLYQRIYPRWCNAQPGGDLHINAWKRDKNMNASSIRTTGGAIRD